VIVKDRGLMYMSFKFLFEEKYMYKFLFGFSVVLFIACLVLLIKVFVADFDWITLVVAVLGMISASLTIWTSQLLKKVKE